MMRWFVASAALATYVIASRPFLEMPDTALETYLKSRGWTEGTRPDLGDMLSAYDFEYAARQLLDPADYQYYRTGAAGEWSYRNNLEVWAKAKWRPLQLQGVGNLTETMK